MLVRISTYRTDGIGRIKELLQHGVSAASRAHSLALKLLKKSTVVKLTVVI